MATAKKSGATKKAAKKSSTAKKSSGTKQARGGIAQPVKPSGELAAVVGKDSLTRADLTKKVWDYIKKNDLQDSKNRRMINADAKLKPIFGGKSQVSMFEMTKLVNQHVSKA
jgi:upstream activation factor subunit UAF30